MINLSKKLYSEMVEHAKSGLPNEVGAYLAGANGIVSKIYKMKNASNTPETFFNFDMKESFKVQKESRAEGLQLLGVYHSHPVGGNKPSDSDKVYLADPNLFYIIISLKNVEPEVNAFWIKKGESGPLELKIID